MHEGDSAARNKLIEHNLRLVAHIIKKYYNVSAEQEDLISIGTIGLIKAVSTFDYAKKTRFATYASRCIENAIITLRLAKKLIYSAVGQFSKKVGNCLYIFYKFCSVRTFYAPLYVHMFRFLTNRHLRNVQVLMKITIRRHLIRFRTSLNVYLSIFFAFVQLLSRNYCLKHNHKKLYIDKIMKICYNICNIKIICHL
ncbi:MAG: sigma-70 family RNA polymerase sigma factor [Oscillospiraceae bacterium]|nr:sigma-70 family RNA polymerase sigma factor [Oscillospiraceae bacterium]